MKSTILMLSALISSSAFADITFSRDARPVDGYLKELKITNENSRHSAKVTLRTAFVDRMSGNVSDTTEVIGVSMDCKAITLGGIICTDDRRPVDGPLTEVIVKNARFGQVGYEAILNTVFVSRMTGGEIRKTKTLAFGLKKTK